MNATPGPKRTTATPDDAGRSCPYCRFPLKEGAECVECGVCHAGHHADCWDDNGNGCAVVACAGGPSEETRELAAQTARQPQPQQVQPQPAAPLAATSPAPAASWAGAESRGSRGPGPWLIAAVLVLALSVAGGAFAVVRSQNSGATTPTRTVTTAEASPNAGDTDSPPPGDTEPAPDEPDTEAPESSGVLPDVSRSQMASDIADMLREHHQDIVDGDFSAAWDLYTSRKQQQKNDEEGYDAWRTSQATLSDYLDPSALSVTIEDVDADTGEVRVDVTGMGWSKPGATCSEWSGITWVRYENGTWLYEPGYSTTPERRSAWQDRFSELLGGNCSSG